MHEIVRMKTHKLLPRKEPIGHELPRPDRHRLTVRHYPTNNLPVIQNTNTVYIYIYREREGGGGFNPVCVFSLFCATVRGVSAESALRGRWTSQKPFRLGF